MLLDGEIFGKSFLVSSGLGSDNCHKWEASLSCNNAASEACAMRRLVSPFQENWLSSELDQSQEEVTGADL